MCLDRLNKTTGAPTGKGWKVFRSNAIGQLVSEMKGNGEPLPRGRWINEKDYRLLPDRDRLGVLDYPTGWHIFVTKEAARSWMSDPGRDHLIKVEFRKAVARGTQVWGRRHRVVVAQEIRIPREKRS